VLRFREFDGIRPPVDVSRLNRESPQAQNIRSYGLVVQNRYGTTYAYDFATEQFVSPYSNAPDFDVGDLGQQLRFNVTSRNAETLLCSHLGDIFAGEKSATMMVVAKFHGGNSTDEDSLIGQWASVQGSSDNNAVRFLLRYDSNANELDAFVDTGTTTSNTVSVSIEDSEYHWLVAHYDGATISIWVDGIQTGTPTSKTGFFNSTSTAKRPEVMGGHLATEVGTDAPRFDMKAWGIWVPRLPPIIIPTLYDPTTRWDLVTPPPRRNFFVPAPAVTILGHGMGLSEIRNKAVI
jgi:hypothetical protein